MSKNNIGENIRKYRMMAGFTQAELAEKLSEIEGKTIAASAVAGYENGQRTPKVEIRVQMARILGIDLVGLSGIELDEMDEKRLLCKLLSKYASDITLNEDGSVGVELPDDFADFQMTYKENRDRLAFLSEDVPEDSLEYEITKKSADDELEYWVERYPAYDAASLCKERKADYTIEDIKDFRKMTSSECEADFFRFQDSYLTPMMNKEIMKRIRKK